MDKTKRGRPPGVKNNSAVELPPLWLIDLIEGDLSGRCLDNHADRRAVAVAITEAMGRHMVVRPPEPRRKR